MNPSSLREKIKGVLYRYIFANADEEVPEAAKAIEVIVVDLLESYGSYLYDDGKYAKKDAYDFRALAENWLPK